MCAFYTLTWYTHTDKNTYIGDTMQCKMKNITQFEMQYHYCVCMCGSLQPFSDKKLKMA